MVNTFHFGLLCSRFEPEQNKNVFIKTKTLWGRPSACAYSSKSFNHHINPIPCARCDRIKKRNSQ